MIIGRVIGTIISTAKHHVLNGYTLLIVHPIGLTGEKVGEIEIALDTVQAGIGEKVILLTEGNSSRMIIGDTEAPVRAVVVGIIDSLEYDLV